MHVKEFNFGKVVGQPVTLTEKSSLKYILLGNCPSFNQPSIVIVILCNFLELSFPRTWNMEIFPCLITKSSSTAGRPRRRLGNTSTCPYVRFDIDVLNVGLTTQAHTHTCLLTYKKVIINCKTHETLAWQHKHMSIRPFGHIAKSSSTDDDVAVYRNARMEMCLCYQVDVQSVLQ